MKKILLIIIILIIQIGVLSSVLYLGGNSERVSREYEQEEFEVIMKNGSHESGFYISAGEENESGNIATPALTLPKGIYKISGVYEMKGDGRVYANYTDGNYKDSINGIIDLDYRANEFSFELHVKDNRPFRVYFRLSSEREEGDYLLIRDVKVETSMTTTRYYGFLCALSWLFFDSLLLCFYKRREIVRYMKGLSDQQIFVGAGLVIATVLISLPAMTGYVNQHFDTAYHLMRVEGIKEGLLSGQFPVRIQPGWMNGHGYATSIMYGELLLYIPALLRLVGLPLGLAYNIYIVIVNAATILVAYYCFWKISDNPYIGFMASVFYATNIYRLGALYVRSAAGKYTAMIFYPLIIYGLWRLFTEDTDKKEYDGIWKILVIGYSGIILSHTISTMFAFGYTLLVCIIMWKKVFHKKTFWMLVKTVTLLVLMNAWFVVPFLDYIRYEWVGNTYDLLEAPFRIQRRAEFIPQFFATDYTVMGNELGYADGITAEMPYTIGIASALIMAGGIMIRGRASRIKRKYEIFIYTLIGLTMFATSTLFPWILVCKVFPFMSFVARVLQYPWRLNAVSISLLALLACLIAQKVEWNKRLQYGFIIMVAMISCLQGLDFESRVLNEANVWFVDELGSGKFYQIGGEYLPSGANPNNYVYKITGQSEDVEIVDWSSHYNSVNVSVKNHGDMSSFEIPLLNYKGYRAWDLETNEQLSISSGTSGRICVEIPKSYEGSIFIGFVSPWYWRVAEMLTVLTAAAWIGYEVMRKKRAARMLGQLSETVS